MNSVLALLPALHDAIGDALADPTQTIDAAATRIGPPVPRPGTIFAAGGNYGARLTEVTGAQDKARPDRPVLFARASSSVTRPADPVIRPAETTMLDYECELAVVIGSPASA
jgi:2,4-didehydro-3-deoxy-L-rhamnonate hydrolase